MKLKDLFKKKTTPKPAPVYEKMWKPEPVKRVIPTVFAKDKNGEIIELSYGSVLEDMCLIAPDGEYYHQYVGCGSCPEWELVTIEEATKRGYAQCWICFKKIEEAQTFWEDEDAEND